MRIAILQNSVGIGGRSKVIAEAIKLFSGQGDDIAIFTVSSKKSVLEFIDYYGLSRDNIELQSYRNFISTIPGTIYQQPALNWKASDLLENFDLVFNSNNCLRFLPSGPKYIHYIHLPVPAIPHVNRRYNNSIFYKLYALPVILSQFFNSSVAQKGIAITNSHFTADKYKRVYGIPADIVIYPPCIESVDLDTFSGEGVVSLGSFHPNKRQLFQLRIAKQLPEISFTLIGSSASSDYYHRCMKYINNHNIKNVTLKRDASSRDVNKALKENKIFLHSMQQEPFGISTVEALNAGCIPVTHDSGGQREIVSDETLRYTTETECIKAINKINNEYYRPNTDEIRNNLKKFTFPHFRNELQDCLNYV